MTCLICKHGETKSGSTTLVFERGTSTVIIKNIPAEICDNCDEAFLAENVSREVLDLANKNVGKGIEVEILNFAAQFSFPS
jgi:YgiT-type zinc finger domain-containing protein